MDTIDDLINQINCFNTRRKELLEKKETDDLFANTELRRIYLEMYSLSKRIAILSDRENSKKPTSE